MILHPLSLPACPMFKRQNWVIVPPFSIIFAQKPCIYSTSYLEKSLWTSKLLTSALEIHRHFVAFNCLPFCLLFSKPTMTVSFGKYRLSIIFSLKYIINIIFRSGNHPHNQLNYRSCVRHCLHVFCGLYLGYGTPWNLQMSWTAATVGTVPRDLSRTAWEGWKMLPNYF